MESFFETHWWLAFALIGMMIPVFGMISHAVSQAMYYRHRRDALDTLKGYAASGKTPPPEVLEALKAETSDMPPWPPNGDPAVWASWGNDRYGRRAARFAVRAARWRYREPYRRWNSAVFLVALTAGFGFASQHAGSADTRDAFLLVAIILGALSIGAVVTALIATLVKPWQN